MAGANLKAVQVRDDADRGRGHAIIELLGSQLPERDWTFAIRRRGFEETNLGPDGWQAAEHRLTPDGVEPAARGIELKVGPEVVGYMTAGNYEISFIAPGLTQPLSAVLPWRNIAPAPMRKGPRRAQLVEQPGPAAPPVALSTAEKVQVFAGRPEDTSGAGVAERGQEEIPPSGDDAGTVDPAPPGEDEEGGGATSKLSDEEAARAAAALAAEQERLRRRKQAMRMRIASLAAALLLLIAGGGTYFYCCGPEPLPPEEKPKDTAQDKDADKGKDSKAPADKKSDTADSGKSDRDTAAAETKKEEPAPAPARSPQDEATNFLAANPTPDQIFTKAEEFRQAGNVDVAMVLLRRPADSGHAASARALGQIYDPAELSPGRKAQRKDGNLAFAHSWYSRAAKAGSAEARADLDRLRQVAEAAAKRGDSTAAGLLQRW